MFNDILYELLSLLFVIVSFIAFLITVIVVPVQYKKTKKNFFLWLLAGIFAVLIVNITLYAPWYCKNMANDAKTIDGIIKYDTYAVKTSVIPAVRGFMYNRLAGDYLKLKKNLDKGIKYQELSYKYGKNKYDLYFLSYLYEVKGDYDKAIDAAQTFGAFPATIAKIYFLKGDTEKALEILTKSIDDSSAKMVEYAYRGNIYDYLGKKELAEKDFKKAVEIDVTGYGQTLIEKIKQDKNYHFTRIKRERERYNIK